ncbi:MAG: GAF domain-containing protein [candidate division Zixibacteria bacterium]|nr:GAF domain-containing protein [candidate division Zixibacteria bacterium]
MITTIENTVEYTDSRPEIIESMQRYFGASPVGLFIIGGGTRFQYINSRAAEIFGLSDSFKSSRVSLSQLEFFFSQPISDKIIDLFKTGEAFKIDRFPGTNLNGHFAYYCLSCHAIFGDNNEVSGIFGIIEDFSEQVKKRQELKRKIDELSILAQISQVVSSALDTQEVLKVILTGVTAQQGLGFNRAFLFLLDDDEKYLVGRLAVGPSNAEEAGVIWSALAQDDRTLLETLSLYQSKTQTSGTNLFDLIGGLRIDTTNGSLFARCLKEKRPIIISNDIELDPVSERILGCLGGRHAALTPLISQDRPLGLLVVDNAITGENITEQDCQFLKLIADQSASAVERSYLYRDIKERAIELEAMNQRLAETQNQIIEAEKMSVIGEITSAVAHELRNPLTIIGGFANLMFKSLPSGSPDAEYLNIIISETQRAEAVLTDVLDFSKASKTKDRCLDMNELVNDTMNMMAVRVGNGKSKMNLSLCDKPLPIWGNSDQLLHAFYQIFLLILQDISDSVGSDINTFEHQGFARMEIALHSKDGLNTDMDRLLKQYFGTGASTKRLSMLVAEETLKHHGGILGFESGSKEGPLVFIQMPLRKEVHDG